MKRVGYLLTEETLTLDLCKLAIIKAARHKHKRVSVIKVLENLEEKAQELRRMVH